MKTLIKLALVAALCIGVTANAAKPRKWAAGSDAGNYKPMSQDILSICEDTDPRRADEVLAKTEGSMENIYLGTTKKAKVIWTSFGTAVMEAETNRKFNKQNWKIVHEMYLEPIHFLFPKGWKPKSDKNIASKWFDKGMTAFDNAIGTKKQPIKINLNMLKGQKIASAGGSIRETEALVKAANLKAKVMPLGYDELAGSGMPVMLVGGAPYKPVIDLLATGNYFLVSIDINTLNRGANFFEGTSVSYKIGKGYKTVPTIGVRSVIMGKTSKKKYKGEEVKDHGMRVLAGCIADNLDEIAEESENSNWDDVAKHAASDEVLSWPSFEPYSTESGDDDEEESDD